MRSLRLLVLVPVAAAALLSACGGPAPDRVAVPATTTPSTTAATSPTTAAVPVTETTVVEDVAVTSVANVVATAHAELAIYTAPGDATAASTLPATTPFGSATTLLVLGETDDAMWLLVSLPVRPNGSTGYIRATDVTLATIDRTVEVDRVARTLQVVDLDGNVILTTSVAVGSDENPTPTGDFYVTDVLDTGDDGGAYGPYALGISAHSDTLSEFGGGDGQIGLHGTNQPSSIGQAASHGCVRLPNDVVAQLAASLPLGTPVSIH